jgi:major membrane immunogen (membrane-anchored lipoprotein)
VIFLVPILPWLGAFLTATAIAYFSGALRTKASGKVLAIIGASQTGKTTLARFLSQGIMGDGTYEATNISYDLKGRTITLDDGTVLHLADLKDVPGETTAWLEWKQRVQRSHYVLYLMRAPYLRQRREFAVDRYRRDLQQLKLWLEAQEKDSRASVLLVSNFRDQDAQAWDAEPSHTAHGAGLMDDAGLQKQVDDLLRITGVQYVSGSMSSEEATKNLMKAITEAL